jgi:hypothetical protein
MHFSSMVDNGLWIASVSVTFLKIYQSIPVQHLCWNPEPSLFVTKVSLYFWNLRSILRFLMYDLPRFFKFFKTLIRYLAKANSDLKNFLFWWHSGCLCRNYIVSRLIQGLPANEKEIKVICKYFGLSVYPNGTKYRPTLWPDTVLCR